LGTVLGRLQRRTVPVGEGRGAHPALEGLLVAPAGDHEPGLAPVGGPEQLEALEALLVVHRPCPLREAARHLVAQLGRHRDGVYPYDRHGAHHAPTGPAPRTSPGGWETDRSGCGRQASRSVAMGAPGGRGRPEAMYHSVPNAVAKRSGGIFRKNESAGIWLAWATIAARFRSTTAPTSTAWVMSSSGLPKSSPTSTSRSSSSSNASSSWGISAIIRRSASRFIVDSKTRSTPASSAARRPNRWTCMWSGCPYPPWSS